MYKNYNTTGCSQSSGPVDHPRFQRPVVETRPKDPLYETYTSLNFKQHQIPQTWRRLYKENPKQNKTTKFQSWYKQLHIIFYVF